MLDTRPQSLKAKFKLMMPENPSQEKEEVVTEKAETEDPEVVSEVASEEAEEASEVKEEADTEEIDQDQRTEK